MTSLLLAVFLAAPARAGGELPPVLDPSAVDRAADPCQDFYQYACGAWLSADPVPADQSVWYRFSLLDEHTRQVLRAILAEDAVEKAGRSEEARKLGDYYAACMDEPGVDAKGLAPLAPELEAVARLEDARALAGELAHLHAIGVSAVFSFGSAQDYTDASRMVAEADQGGWSLPDRDYYLQDAYKGERADYAAHVARMFVLLGDSKERAAAEAAAVLRLEAALAKASMGRVERREPKNVHHKMALADFAALTPSFDWKAYLAGLGSPAFDSLDAADPGFYKGLETELRAAPLADWKSLLRWDLAHSLHSALPTAFVDEDFAFFGRRLDGQKELKARWKRCVRSADGELGEALGKEYVAREFPPEAKARAQALVAAIERAMRADLGSLDWMGGATRAKALEKLAALADKIGYPDRWRDYSKLEVRPGDALGNLERAEGFEARRQLAKIGRPVDRGEWDMTPPTDNAYYDPMLNDINFPAGTLQRPNFDLAADTAALLGNIGATVGHELTHAFDDEGRHYDARGNLADWWTEADGNAFEARAKGFVDEYSGFVTVADTDPAKAVHLDGRLTLGENIADNGGLRLAYEALEEALGSDDPPPVDGWTARQRFFVSYAQSWCANETEASRREDAKADPHSTGRWRVDGVVLNMPQFAEAFACKAGTPMAPLARNRVW